MQAALQTALSHVADEPIQITAAGRTDTGVHATHQVVSFTTRAERPEKAWVTGTNSQLPGSVRVQWARPVHEHFNARFSALYRRYLYLFYEAANDPLSRDRVCTVEPLDDSQMHLAARHLIGERDFSTFRASGCQSASPFRCVQRAQVHRWGPIVGIDVAANAFLLRMMRNIAGGLRDVGRGVWSVADFAAALAARDRRALGKTAPPGGLYLVDVGYPAALSDVPLPVGRVPSLLAAHTSLDRL